MKKILSIRQAKRFVDFLEENKDLVGLSDWTIMVNMKEFDKEQGVLARAAPDMFEKEMIIYLTKAFLKLEKHKQRNVLLHELIHGRVCVFNEKIDRLKDLEEELLVNDLARGLERLNKFEL